jgi:hypothetical protein
MIIVVDIDHRLNYINDTGQADQEKQGAAADMQTACGPPLHCPPPKRNRPMTRKSFWSYQASTPTPSFEEIPSGGFNGTREEWESLSPGMRREIVRTLRKMSTITFKAE